MNQHEKELAKYQLENEQQVLKDLKAVYRKALKDVQANIAGLNARTDMQNIQSIVHQKKYQKAIEAQIKDILKHLNDNSYQTIEDYIMDCYDNGYIGQMWKMQKETGVTMVTPIDQKKVLQAYTHDSALSKNYYKANPVKGRVAENFTLLKKRVKSNVSRGIAAGMTWTEVAYNLASGMKNSFDKAMFDAMRIARTEGHRVNQQGYLDAGQKAKEAGADCVKQWDATLDGVTRPWHREADGQIREMDDDFTVGGEKMQAPSVGGSARNVCNCRCQLLIRARWALDEDELKTLQDRAKFFGLDKTQDFEDFKQKYLKIPEEADTLKLENLLNKPVDSEGESYNKLLAKLTTGKVEYKPVENHKSEVTEEQIISNLGGGDNTQGSCASVGLAYIGQKLGWNVLDFRDGMSRKTFANHTNIGYIAKLEGVSSKIVSSQRPMKDCLTIFNEIEEGKEYYLASACHAAMIRKINGKVQYLELQSGNSSGYTNGWHDFENPYPNNAITNVKDALKWRFGVPKTKSKYLYKTTLIEAESLKDNLEFKSLLGFINTAENEQRKGSNGTIK